MKNFKIKWFNEDVQIHDYQIASGEDKNEALEKVIKHHSIIFDPLVDKYTIEETDEPAII